MAFFSEIREIRLVSLVGRPRWDESLDLETVSDEVKAGAVSRGQNKNSELTKTRRIYSLPTAMGTTGNRQKENSPCPQEILFHLGKPHAHI